MPFQNNNLKKFQTNSMKKSQITEEDHLDLIHLSAKMAPHLKDKLQKKLA